MPLSFAVLLLVQSMHMIADAAAGEVQARVGHVQTRGGELSEATLEIAIVCLVFGITLVLMSQKGRFKKVEHEVVATEKCEPVAKRLCHSSTSGQQYNTALRKKADIGDVPGCVKLCKEMRLRDIEPTETTYAILLDACINADDFGRAQSLLKEFCETGTRVSSSLFQRHVRNLVDLGCVDEAGDLLEQFLPVFKVCQQPTNCEVMLRAYADLQNSQGCARMVDLAKQFGVHLDAAAVERALSVYTLAQTQNGQDIMKSRFNSASKLQSPPFTAPRRICMLGAEASQREPRSAAHDDASPKTSNRLSQFISLNRLDAKAAQMLRQMPAVQSDWVMDQEFIIDVDPAKNTSSSRVLGTILQTDSKSSTFWKTYPTNFDLARRLSDFAHINKLDVRCAKTLEKLSAEHCQWVMDQEFVIQVDPTKGTASAKVIGQVMKLRTSSSER